MTKSDIKRQRSRIAEEGYAKRRMVEMEKESLRWLSDYAFLGDQESLNMYKLFTRKASWYARKADFPDTFIHKVDKESTQGEKVSETARKRAKTRCEEIPGTKTFRHYAFVPVEGTPDDEVRDMLSKILAGRIRRYFRPQKRLIGEKEYWAYDFRIAWNEREEITK